jgi:hypothetical protein
MKRNNFFKNLHGIYLVILIIIFLIPSFIIFYFNYNLPFGEKPNMYLRILCIINIIIILSIITINIKMINKKIKYNIVMTILMQIYFTILVIMNIDFYFFNLDLCVFYNIVNIINFALYIFIGIISMAIFSNEMIAIGYGITGLIFTLFYSIIFAVIFRMMKYKNNSIRNIVFALYCLQCNTCLVFLFYANKFIQSV